VSRERAQRRALRLAEAERDRARRERAATRKARRRAVTRRLRPRLPDRRTGRLYARRTPIERAAVALAAAVTIGLIWWQIDSLATRVALTVLIVVVSPALIVLTFDRRT
jgi:Flp pilus assembly protein TadB